jgi:hypothetical protein
MGMLIQCLSVATWGHHHCRLEGVESCSITITEYFIMKFEI